jgi:hypothetical protein
MPRLIILGIVILFASFFGYAGYRLRGGGRIAVSLAVIGAVIALLLMRLMGVF